MEEAYHAIILWLANLWVSMGRPTEDTFHALVIGSRFYSAGRTVETQRLQQPGKCHVRRLTESDT